MLADDLQPHTPGRVVSAGPTRVLVAGGGVAALELVLALRALAGHRVALTLLTEDARHAPPAMTVAEPFERGGARTHDWAQVTRDHDARLVLDKLVAVDTGARTAFTRSGRRLRYDVLVVATGARRVAPFPGALTFGAAPAAHARLREVVADAARRDAARLAFALAFPATWPLPLYELALLAADELRAHGSSTAIRILTPEHEPLELFGPAASDALAPLLQTLGVEVVAGVSVREVVAGGARLDGGEVVAADHVVTVADVVARPIAGLPVDGSGFVPVDLHGRVRGEPAVYAAGEVTSFPLRQGGLAAQQADAVAEAVAAACGAGVDPQPFRPVLRGRLLTSGAPLYLQSRPSGQSVASTRALWSPPAKVAGRYLAAYLSTARPSRTRELTELVPGPPAPPGERDAVVLARRIAAAEAACGNPTRARQAREAADALCGGAQDVTARDDRRAVAR